jgi:hypothetical protein
MTAFISCIQIKGSVYILGITSKLNQNYIINIYFNIENTKKFHWERRKVAQGSTLIAFSKFWFRQNLVNLYFIMSF